MSTVWLLDPSVLPDAPSTIAIAETVDLPNDTIDRMVGAVVQRYRAAQPKPDQILVDLEGPGALVLDVLRQCGVPAVGFKITKPLPAGWPR